MRVLILVYLVSGLMAQVFGQENKGVQFENGNQLIFHMTLQEPKNSEEISNLNKSLMSRTGVYFTTVNERTRECIVIADKGFDSMTLQKIFSENGCTVSTNYREKLTREKFLLYYTLNSKASDVEMVVSGNTEKDKINYRTALLLLEELKTSESKNYE